MSRTKVKVFANGLYSKSLVDTRIFIPRITLVKRIYRVKRHFRFDGEFTPLHSVNL